MAVTTDKVDDVAVGFGEKVGVAPVGNPLTLSVTWPLKLPLGVIVTV